MSPRLLCFALAATAVLGAHAATAAEVRYQIDPTHTFPSFTADHMGMSFWRGKFNRAQGEISLDKAAGSGAVTVRIETASIDFGLDAMNEAARGADLFDVARYPEAVFKGKLAGFKDGAPTRVEGELSLHGKTRPLVLQIDRFKCMPHPMVKREWCGANATGRFQRNDFGMNAGADYGFDMAVDLQIQVEAIAAQ